jgi:hypothetical protein
MKLTSLTITQRERLYGIKQEHIDKYLSFQEINKNIVIEVITLVYGLIKKPCPKIYQVKSPMAGQRLANQWKGTKNKFYTFGTFLTIGWASFYAWANAFVEFGIIEEKKFGKYFALRKVSDSGIFLTIEFEHAIIVIEKPIILKRLNGKMHSIDGPAIQWRDGYCQYYINGRKMPSWIFDKLKNNTLTKEDFIKEENEDVKAGIYEIIEARGEGSMLTFLGAKEIDRKTFVHANGELEEIALYKTTEKFKSETDLNGKSNVPLAWVRMTCPSTGTNYLLPSDSSFSKCEDAVKFHRPSVVPNKKQYTWNARS